MVTQPSFMFGEVDRTGYPHYLLGSILSVTVAALGGLFLVASSQTKEVPLGIFMTVGGLCSLGLGLLHIGTFPLMVGLDFCAFYKNSETTLITMKH